MSEGLCETCSHEEVHARLDTSHVCTFLSIDSGACKGAS